MAFADPQDFPVCVMEVNLTCCNDCPVKIKNTLKKIDGVFAIKINPEKNLVTVNGTVGPETLIKALAKIGKKAEICAYEKHPKKLKMKLHQNGQAKNGRKNQSHSCSDDDEDNDHRRNMVEPRIPRPPLPRQPRRYGIPSPGYGFLPQQPMRYGFQPPGYGFPPPQPTAYEFPPPQGYGFPPPQGYGFPPPPGYGYAPQYSPVDHYRPPVRITTPPLPYPYNFYERKEPPVGNSMFDMFSDANVEPCSIM